VPPGWDKTGRAAREPVARGIISRYQGDSRDVATDMADFLCNG
jgi:hypothetical protein